MSKYDALWAHIQNCGQPQLTLTFDEIGRIAGTPLGPFFFEIQKRAAPIRLRGPKNLHESAECALCPAFAGRTPNINHQKRSTI